MKRSFVICLIALSVMFAACGSETEKAKDCETAQYETWGPLQMMLLIEVVQSRTALPKVKIEAIRKLVEIGDQRAVPTLVGALDEEEAPETVKAAEDGLVQMGVSVVSTLRKERQLPTNGKTNRFREEKINQVLLRLNAK